MYEQTNRLNVFSPGQRSNIIGDPSLSPDRPRAQLVSEWFNIAAFAFPGNGVLGKASKSVGTGPGFNEFRHIAAESVSRYGEAVRAVSNSVLQHI